MMMTAEQARQLRAAIRILLRGLNDDEALTVPAVFEPWKAGVNYSAGDRRRSGEILYKCIQGHASQAGWEPENTPALWARISVEEWPEWIQPVGSEDAYSAGDKSSHNGKRWISDVDGNVWAPGVYGWTEATT